MSYLRWGSEVDDALQLHSVSKLLHQEGVPVLVDGPLCSVDTTQLKHVQGKDVPDRKQTSPPFRSYRRRWHLPGLNIAYTSFQLIQQQKQ